MFPKMFESTGLPEIGRRSCGVLPPTFSHSSRGARPYRVIPLSELGTIRVKRARRE